MASKIIAALVAAVVALLGFGSYKSRKLKTQKEKTEEAEAKALIREKQMEAVHEIRNQLGLIEEEEKPEKKSAPTRGDSGSRIERLNRMHDNKDSN